MNSRVRLARQCFDVGDFAGAAAIYEDLARSLPSPLWWAEAKRMRALSADQTVLEGDVSIWGVLRQQLGVDGVLAVNLARRPDRYVRLAREFAKARVPVQRIEAVDAANSMAAQEALRLFKTRPLVPRLASSSHISDEVMRRYKAELTAGVFGYLLSQAHAIRLARERGYRRVLVLDDDVFFHSNALKMLQSLAGELPGDAKIVLLGASEYADRAGQEFLNARLEGCSGLYRPIPGQTCGSFAVIYDASIYDELVAAIEELDGTYDNVVLGHFYRKYPEQCFAVDSAILIPDVGDSDIRPNPRAQETHGAKMGWEFSRYNEFVEPIRAAVIVSSRRSVEGIECPLGPIANSVQIQLFRRSADGLRPLIPGRVNFVHVADQAVGDVVEKTPSEQECAVDVPMNSQFIIQVPAHQRISDDYLYSELLRVINAAAGTQDVEVTVNPRRVVPGRHSVIIPCFREAHLVMPAVMSALLQDAEDVEVIVVNDNPRNLDFGHQLRAGLISLLDAQKEPWRISRLLTIDHKINRNASAARNTGLLRSTGEFISFLDDDDRFEPSRVRLAGERLVATGDEVGACYCGYRGTWNGAEDRSRFPEGNLFEMVLTLAYAKHYMCTNTITFKRGALSALGGFNEAYRRHQDLELMARFFLSFKIAALQVFLVENRPNPVPETFSADVPKLLRLKMQFLEDFGPDIAKLGEKFMEDVLAAHTHDVVKRDKAMPPAQRELIGLVLRASMSRRLNA